MEQVKSSLAPEYFEAIKNELEKREHVTEDENKKENKNINPNSFEKLKFIFLFLKEFALNLLEKMKNRNAFLVAAIKSNTKNFLLFCKNLLQVILRKMKII